MTLPAEAARPHTDRREQRPERVRPESMFGHVTLLLTQGVLLAGGLIAAGWFLLGRPATRE